MIAIDARMRRRGAGGGGDQSDEHVARGLPHAHAASTSHRRHRPRHREAGYNCGILQVNLYEIFICRSNPTTDLRCRVRVLELREFCNPLRLWSRFHCDSNVLAYYLCLKDPEEMEARAEAFKQHNMRLRIALAVLHYILKNYEQVSERHAGVPN